MSSRRGSGTSGRPFGDRFGDGGRKDLSMSYKRGQVLQNIDHTFPSADDPLDSARHRWKPSGELSSYPFDSLKSTDTVLSFLAQIWKALQFTGRKWQVQTLGRNPSARAKAYLKFNNGRRRTLAEILEDPNQWPVGVGIVVHESGKKTRARLAYRPKAQPNQIVIYEEVIADDFVKAAGPQTVSDFAEHPELILELLVPMTEMSYDEAMERLAQAARKHGLPPEQLRLVIEPSPVDLTRQAGEVGEPEWEFPEGRARGVDSKNDYNWVLEILSADPIACDAEGPQVLVIDTTKVQVPPISRDRLGQ